MKSHELRQATRVADISDWMDTLKGDEVREMFELAGNMMVTYDMSFLAAFEAVMETNR